MKKNILLLLWLFLTGSSYSQELYCFVHVNASQLQLSDKTIIDNLQNAIYEFMNNRKWTNYEFKQEEKIECSILITLTSYDNVENFSGTIQVQSRRPVYNSTYSTPMLNYQDKDFTFKYALGQPLEFYENVFPGNLAAVLAYYAYIIIGLDFDSFQPLGGTPFYEKAQAIVNSAQSAPDKGWKAGESQKNRYWLVENLLNNSYADFRQGLYYYHLKGLDVFTQDETKARAGILDGLTMIQRAYRQKPGLFIVSLFTFAKSDEFVNIFKPAPLMEKTRAVNILRNIDPANSAKYNQILTTQ